MLVEEIKFASPKITMNILRPPTSCPNAEAQGLEQSESQSFHVLGWKLYFLHGDFPGPLSISLDPSYPKGISTDA